MKRTIKQIIVLCALLCLLAVLAGCGYDNTVEDLFTLPRVPGIHRSEPAAGSASGQRL